MKHLKHLVVPGTSARVHSCVATDTRIDAIGEAHLPRPVQTTKADGTFYSILRGGRV